MSYIAINTPDSDEDNQPLLMASSSESQELSRFVSTRNPTYNGLSSPSRSAKSKKTNYCDVKTIAFFGVGIVTLLYCILELGIGGYIHSLALLADGFHNLSDVVSLIIANWANQATKRPSTFDMSFGWARSEILGGLINAVFLLALCLYTSLEAIFAFVAPTPMTAGWWYIGVAALGVAINTFGTIIFCLTGNAHGHSHGGGGHGHSHGGDDHGHGHGHGGSKKKKKHGHGHGHGDKKEKHGHGHGDKKEKHGHGHGHGEKKEKHGHGHGHGEKKEKHGHGHGDKKKEKHGHGHGHGDKKEKHGHAHDEKKERRDENVYAVFIHYLGDMISSLLVLAAGLLIHFLSDSNHKQTCITHSNTTADLFCEITNSTSDLAPSHCCEIIPTQWTDYLDPITSLLIVVLILYTSLPVVIRCVWILLQRAPEQMSIVDVRQEILDLDGVASIHDLHIWQLVDGMVFCSAHVSVRDGIPWTYVVTAIREILHSHGVHSSSIQPEFIASGAPPSEFCEQNCVQDCEEDWCCKTPSDIHKENALEDIHSN